MTKKQLTPELSRRLGRLFNTPYVRYHKIGPALQKGFFKVATESELSPEVQKVIQLCDRSGDLAVELRSDDDAAVVAELIKRLRQSGEYDQYFTEEEITEDDIPEEFR